jgi:hypothetical protein
MRIRSARCFGVYASGDADDDTIAAPEGVTRSPHSRQNFADGGSSVRQFEQLRTRRAPHSTQNLACAGFSCRHAGHCINHPRAVDAFRTLSRVLGKREARHLCRRFSRDGSGYEWDGGRSLQAMDADGFWLIFRAVRWARATTCPLRPDANTRNDNISGDLGVWRSPVAHLLWEQGVGGSNPLTPTNIDTPSGATAATSRRASPCRVVRSSRLRHRQRRQMTPVRDLVAIARRREAQSCASF